MSAAFAPGGSEARSAERSPGAGRRADLSGFTVLVPVILLCYQRPAGRIIGQTARSMENGQTSVRIFMNPHLGPDKMGAPGHGGELQDQPLKAHSIVVSHRPFF